MNKVRLVRTIGFMFLGTILLSTPGCRIAKNLYLVEEGNLFRSAQLTYEELIELHEKGGVRTILNLRGASPGEDWYDEQVKAVNDTGMTLIDIGMSASRLPHREDLIQLLDAFQNAPRPILVHCKAGADRTGEAVAIYQMLYMGYNKREALKALSPKYLHLPPFTPAKRYFINLWESELWARNDYDPCVEEYEYYDQAAHCGSPRPPLGEEEDT